MKNPRIIISGGGTGGHIFPAVSIANALKKLRPEAEILFVGAKDRMEMQRVPQAGYKIIGLPVKGLIRPLWSPKNIGILIDFLKSKREVKKIIKEFKPDVAVGVGGYASAATLNAAYDMGVPCLIQEQNSFAGLTNKTLAKKASKICVAYDGMERFFPADRILLTGNPIRQSLLNPELDKTEALAEFGLTSSKPVILLIGGSLGARTLNNSVLKSLELIRSSNVQFIWQTGSYYKESIANELEKCGKPDNLYVTDFIRSMDKAYKATDLVISRAGASSISELCLLGKPSILVPSPNVAEDHQTHNAMALVRKEAALLVKDIEAEEKLIPLAVKTVNDQNKLHSLGANALAMALTDSDVRIAEEVLQLIKND
jgi:UDP-N-acetylglucosamine--N-acetylmuramyl-(pentapeptide) pyrophosphoryl-undecaprenol N-acetylglucosamine transferase